MSTDPQYIAAQTTHPQGATNALLNVIASAGGTIGLAVQVGEVLVPLVVGIIKNIKSRIIGTTVEYTIVLQTENAMLDAIIASGAADLQTINSELTRLGLPVLAMPAVSPAP